MRHDWIFDVLADLHSYADQNGLPGLKAKVEETLLVARLEARCDGPQEGEAAVPGVRPVRRAH